YDSFSFYCTCYPRDLHSFPTRRSSDLAEQVAGRPVSYEMFRDALLVALKDAGIELEHSELTDGERYGLEKVGAKISSDDMVQRRSEERRVGKECRSEWGEEG